MVSYSPLHYYKPTFMYLTFTSFFKQELTYSQWSVLRAEIPFIIDKSESFNLKQ